MDALTKAQENFLRGCLNEMDCELRKSRARNPNAQTYGKYGIYDREGNRWLTRGFVLTFEEAEDSFIRMVAERATDFGDGPFTMTLGEIEDEVAPQDPFDWLWDTYPLSGEYATRVLALIAEEAPDDE